MFGDIALQSTYVIFYCIRDEKLVTNFACWNAFSGGIMDNIISTSFKKVLKLSTSLTFASLASCSVLLLLPF